MTAPTDLEQAKELQKRLQVALDSLRQRNDFTILVIELKRYTVEGVLLKAITDADSMIERWSRKEN